MALATVSRARRAALRARGRGSLTRRILAVNMVALLLAGLSLFYLDGFRTRLIAERQAQGERSMRIVGAVLARAPAGERAAIIDASGRASGNHLRLYGADGTMQIDSWKLGPRSFTLVDPTTEGWDKRAARWVDAGVDRVVQARRADRFLEHGAANASAWEELACVKDKPGAVCMIERRAPDRTPVLGTAVALDTRPVTYLLSMTNTRDVTDLVRAERVRLVLIVLSALLLSIALSVFLARTIVAPIRQLTLAAIRVRAGRARQVVVPRLPERSDEIGVLARAVSDMAQALRTRIDATEGFAADVAHELKNPLASLSSAVESLGRVKDPALHQQLTGVIAGDVRRIDRLITDISTLSRLDAQLTRSDFTEVDLSQLVARLTDARRERLDRQTTLLSALPDAPVMVLGEPERLARAIDNLIDNALSFSPDGGSVRVTVVRDDEQVSLSVEDEGPGVPKNARAAIFDRFHSDRPDPQTFGNHSGLGLAIAKTIIEGHSGTITVGDRDSSARGACFTVTLPVSEASD